MYLQTLGTPMLTHPTRTYKTWVRHYRPILHVPPNPGYAIADPSYMYLQTLGTPLLTHPTRTYKPWVRHC